MVENVNAAGGHPGSSREPKTNEDNCVGECSKYSENDECCLVVC